LESSSIRFGTPDSDVIGHARASLLYPVVDAQDNPPQDTSLMRGSEPSGCRQPR
jgi:hypothetical protein